MFESTSVTHCKQRHGRILLGGGVHLQTAALPAGGREREREEANPTATPTMCCSIRRTRIKKIKLF